PKKTIRSRNGIKVTLDDTDGQETLTLETPGGQKVTLKDGGGSVEVKDSNGNSIKLDSGGITIAGTSKVTVRAGQVEVNAGKVQVNAGLSKFSGVVQADVVKATTVIGTTYTPGVG